MKDVTAVDTFFFLTLVSLFFVFESPVRKKKRMMGKRKRKQKKDTGEREGGGER